MYLVLYGTQRELLPSASLSRFARDTIRLFGCPHRFVPAPPCILTLSECLFGCLYTANTKQAILKPFVCIRSYGQNGRIQALSLARASPRTHKNEPISRNKTCLILLAASSTYVGFDIPSAPSNNPS